MSRIRFGNRSSSKMKNQKTVVDGISFDSKKEARRFGELLYLVKAGEISKLRTQVPFVLVPKNDKHRAVKYYADFVYIDNRTGKTIVEDTKGYKTDIYKIKQKLMYHVHGISILET